MTTQESHETNTADPSHGPPGILSKELLERYLHNQLRLGAMKRMHSYLKDNQKKGRREYILEEAAGKTAPAIIPVGARYKSTATQINRKSTATPWDRNDVILLFILVLLHPFISFYNLLTFTLSSIHQKKRTYLLDMQTYKHTRIQLQHADISNLSRHPRSHMNPLLP